MDHLSKDQLAELQTDLETERGRLKSRLGLIDEDLAGGLAHDVGDQQDVPAEEANRLAERGVQDHVREHLARVEAALHRIESGSYGLCADTDEPIPFARLKAEPTTRYTVEALEMMEKEGRSPDADEEVY